MTDVQPVESETVVTPPDELVAGEYQSIENFKKIQGSRSSSNVSSRMHLQEPKKKKYTPAAQQRNDIHKSMLALFEAESKKDEKEEDEIDLAFSACAVRMRIHLNKDQREDVIQEVEAVVRKAINNVRKGMPALTPSPRPASPAQPPPPAPSPFFNTGANVIPAQVNMQPPVQQQQQHQLQNQPGNNTGSGDFFRPYDESRTYSYTSL